MNNFNSLKKYVVLLIIFVLSSSVVSASPKKNLRNSGIDNIDIVLDDILDNSKVWKEVENLSSRVNIKIRWKIPTRREIDRFARAYKRRNSRHLREVLNRGKRYIPLIKQIFSRYRLPDELVFLPVIESSFKIRSVSHSGAAGLWQFMPITAKEYGLRIDRWIDERYDVEKSTIAAARYLRDLHTEFGNWYTALAGYRIGEFSIKRRIGRRGKKNFWKVEHKIPYSARKYTLKFLGTLKVIREILPRERISQRNLDFEIVKVNRQVSLREISNITGVSYRVLKRLNPHLKRGITPPYRGVFNVYVPKGYKHTVEVALNLRDLNIKLSKLNITDRDVNQYLGDIDKEVGF